MNINTFRFGQFQPQPTVFEVPMSGVATSTDEQRQAGTYSQHSHLGGSEKNPTMLFKPLDVVG